MARRRKMDPERKAFINSLLEHYQPKDAQDIQDMLKDLLGETLQGMLEAEMDDHLGYSKYDYKNKETDDSRNGYSPKTVTSSMGTIDLDIPRDRKGDFEPQIVKKNQTDISNIEDQVLSMYAKGMTTRDISAHLKDVYGVDASAEMISHMTDRILPIAKEWQNRPLERKYAIVFMDAVHFHVREDNRTVSIPHTLQHQEISTFRSVTHALVVSQQTHAVMFRLLLFYTESCKIPRGFLQLFPISRCLFTPHFI